MARELNSVIFMVDFFFFFFYHESRGESRSSWASFRRHRACPRVRAHTHVPRWACGANHTETIWPVPCTSYVPVTTSRAPAPAVFTCPDRDAPAEPRGRTLVCRSCEAHSPRAPVGAPPAAASVGPTAQRAQGPLRRSLQPRGGPPGPREVRTPTQSPVLHPGRVP